MTTIKAIDDPRTLNKQLVIRPSVVNFIFFSLELKVDRH
jgi:hypothetical protein